MVRSVPALRAPSRGRVPVKAGLPLFPEELKIRAHKKIHRPVVGCKIVRIERVLGDGAILKGTVSQNPSKRIQNAVKTTSVFLAEEKMKEGTSDLRSISTDSERCILKL